jgi:predicted outer membrane repeat protein
VDAGGAINVATAGLTLSDCVLTGNSSNTTTGAVFVSGTGALTVLNSTLSNNSAGSDGGGINVRTGGTLTVRRSTISGNTALHGGGISSSGATTQIENSTFEGNTASVQGGGIYVSGRTVVISGTTFSGNRARQASGLSGPTGGGIYLNGIFTAQVINSTFSGNEASSGAAIMMFQVSPTQGTLSLQNCTITQNMTNGAAVTASSASQVFTINVISTIIAGNIRSDLQPAGDIGADGYAITLIRSAIGNLGNQPLTPASGNNLPSGTPLLLGPLVDNGGPTKTHALLAGSPCIDAGANPAGVLTDQRGFGFPRIAGAATDIGAYEFIPAGTPTASADPLPDVVQPGGTAYDFVVTFRDDSAVSVATLGNGDIRVTGPNGFSTLTPFVGVDLNTNGTPRSATFRLTPPGGAWDATDNGTYTVSVEPNQVADTSGNFAFAAALGQIEVAMPVTVESIQVNDGSAQRSRVTSLTVTFSGTVQFASAAVNAFDLRRADGTSIAISPSVSVNTGRTVVTLAFTGAGLEAGSLTDGNYTLTVFGGAAQSGPTGPLLDADGDGLPCGDRAFQFHPLFGDVNGDKAVNGFDLTAFRSAFGAVMGDASYNVSFDFNGDGAINGLDLTAFRSRFGVILP